MKNLTLKVAAVALAAIGLGASIVAARAAEDENVENLEQSRIEQGLRISPVHLSYDEKDRDLVGLGSYIVNAQAGCNDCHTNPSYAPGGDPFQGQPKRVNAEHYLAGGQHFGPFVSRNITPVDGRPAGRTLPEFEAIMRHGVDLNKAHPQISKLLQVMPWPSFQSMKEHDLRAIYEYLRAIPHAEPGQ